MDVKNLTNISQEGENVLLVLMNEGAKFRCRGVSAKQILRHLASGRHRNVKEDDEMTWPTRNHIEGEARYVGSEEFLKPSLRT